MVVKSDAFANASARFTGGGEQAEAVEALVAGGVEFALPQAWGRLGATAAKGDAQERLGTVVSGLCPGGSEGSACVDGTQLTFIAYSGEDGRELPLLTEFEDQLDAKLAKRFPGFSKGDAAVKPAADGTRWLDYGFSWRSGREQVTQRFAAYRHADGSGVVAMITGAELEQHAAAIDDFLASAHDPTAGGE